MRAASRQQSLHRDTIDWIKTMGNHGMDHHMLYPLKRPWTSLAGGHRGHRRWSPLWVDAVEKVRGVRGLDSGLEKLSKLSA